MFFAIAVHSTVVSMGTRFAAAFPETAVLNCRAGTAAMKGNVPAAACTSFRRALEIDPMLWEAFEGLCTLGMSLCACET
jgi:anaphase-promoting complex subunit 3